MSLLIRPRSLQPHQVAAKPHRPQVGERLVSHPEQRRTTEVVELMAVPFPFPDRDAQILFQPGGMAQERRHTVMAASCIHVSDGDTMPSKHLPSGARSLAATYMLCFWCAHCGTVLLVISEALNHIHK